MNRFTELWRRLERVSPAPYDFNDGISQQQLIYGIGLVAHEFEALQQIVMQLFSVICGADRDAWNF